MVVAASSRRLPTSAFQRSSDMSPPAEEMASTATADRSENRRNAWWPTAKAHCAIAHAAKPNASTAASVCTKSCQVKSGPTGTGQPGVHVTCESSRKKPHEIQSETAGAHRASARGRARMPRPAHATSDPPTAMSTRVTWNHRAVGMPGAPSSLT